MGFDLGLLGVGAVSARKGYQDAEKQARDEEFLKATRDYQLANAKESADLRPDRMAANRASLGYATARDTSNTGLLPAQAADTRAKLELSGEQTAAQRQILPGATANTLATQRGAASDLAFADSQRPITQTIQSIRNRNTKFTVDAEAQTLPMKAQTQVAQGILSAEDAKSHLIGTAAGYLNSGDKESAVQLFQNVFDNTNLFPMARGSKLRDIEKVDNPDGSWHARFIDDQGGIIADIPQAKFAQAYTSSIGKKETVKLAPGETLMGVSNGKAVQLGENKNTRYGAAGTYGRNGAPAEVKMYQWLTGNDPDNKIKIPLEHQAAMDFIKQSKGKSRADFLVDVLAKDVMYATANPEKKAQIKKQYEETYDDLHQKGAGLNDASNSAAPTTINPDIERLISGGE